MGIRSPASEESSSWGSNALGANGLSKGAGEDEEERAVRFDEYLIGGDGVGGADDAIEGEGERVHVVLETAARDDRGACHRDQANGRTLAGAVDADLNGGRGRR